jgi:hypothetical protein
MIFILLALIAFAVLALAVVHDSKRQQQSADQHWRDVERQ